MVPDISKLCEADRIEPDELAGAELVLLPSSSKRGDGADF